MDSTKPLTAASLLLPASDDTDHHAGSTQRGASRAGSIAKPVVSGPAAAEAAEAAEPDEQEEEEEDALALRPQESAGDEDGDGGEEGEGEANSPEINNGGRESGVSAAAAAALHDVASALTLDEDD